MARGVGRQQIAPRLCSSPSRVQQPQRRVQSSVPVVPILVEHTPTIKLHTTHRNVAAATIPRGRPWPTPPFSVTRTQQWDTQKNRLTKFCKWTKPSVSLETLYLFLRRHPLGRKTIRPSPKSTWLQCLSSSGPQTAAFSISSSSTVHDGYPRLDMFQPIHCVQTTMSFVRIFGRSGSVGGTALRHELDMGY